MEIKIESTKENPLLKRKEVNFRVEQDPRGKTPGRLEVKKAVATKLKMKEDRVFIKKMRTLTGTSTAVGIANAYETVEQAKFIEPGYIRERNRPPEPKEEENE